MKKIYLSILIFVISTGMCFAADSAFRDIPMSEVEAAFSTTPGHPRLFISDKQMAEIKKRIATDPDLRIFSRGIIEKADGILDDSPVTRKLTGRRLLGVSRRCLDRVTHLSAAYRLTDKKAYLQRAEKELLAAAGFSDWNPSHFLDVAEMTAALAIGYDWLYNDLSADSRAKIKAAIMDKGLKPATSRNHGWIRGSNNWNQVCNGGIALGGLALMEDEPELAKKLVHRAVNGVQVVMKQYEPDGAYPEGPGYWVYGTTYNIVLFSALDSVLKTDFGLSKAGGFSNCAWYFLNVAGPTGLYFNYPDSGSRSGFTPAVFWFAQKYNEPALAWSQYQIMKANSDNPSQLVSSRLAPLAMAWLGGKKQVPGDLCWMGRGSNPVAMFRTSWTDPDATYLAIKGGSPGVSHGHMDVGTFVIDSQGQRWAADLGPESYNKIESRGMNLWGRAQNAQRWTIFRYNNLSHSTLVVDGQFQKVNGSAPVIAYSDDKAFSHVVFDMSKVYDGQLASSLRGAGLLPDGQIVIKDEFKAAGKDTTVRWAMVASADVATQGGNKAYLKKGGKTMVFTVLSDKPVHLKTWSTEPREDYDAKNPGTILLGFEVPLKAGESADTIVMISKPGISTEPEQAAKSLLEWSGELKD